MEEKTLLKDKIFDFAIRIVKLCKYLSETKKEYVLSKQLAATEYLSDAEFQSIHSDAVSILNILTAISKSTKRNA